MNSNYCGPEIEEPRPRVSVFLTIIVVLLSLVIAFLCWQVYVLRSEVMSKLSPVESTQLITDATTIPESSVLDAVKQPLPVFDEPLNGAYLSNISLPKVVPLTIETVKEYNYVFVLEPLYYGNSETSATKAEKECLASGTMIRFFVWGGRELTIDIPVGQYNIYYAYGTDWYGRNDLFGDNTRYYKCNSTYTFKKNAKDPVTLELWLFDFNTDMATVISRDDFPK